MGACTSSSSSTKPVAVKPIEEKQNRPPVDNDDYGGYEDQQDLLPSNDYNHYELLLQPPTSPSPLPPPPPPQVKDTDSTDADAADSKSFDRIKQAFKQQREALPKDWNEDYQKIFNRNTATPHDLKQQAVALAKVRQSFIDYATAAAMAVISTKLYPQQQPPLVQQDMNAGGIAGGAKFFVGKVMFKFAVNERGVYANDIEAQKAAALEVKATSALVELNSPHIHTTLTCIVRYRGFCVYAIALAPLDCLLYGSCDAAKTVADASDTPAVRTVIVDLATQLHLREHGVLEKSTQTAKRLCMPVDIEVHKGTDGRLYIVDTARMLPPTPPRDDVRGAVFTRHFRPEMMLRLRHMDGMPRLSSDAYSNFSVADEYDDDVRDIGQAYAFMHEQVIPELAAVLVTGGDVAAHFHEMGVNMRYIPSVAVRCDDANVRRWLCEEMIVRFLKVSIRHSWVTTTNHSDQKLLDELCGFLERLVAQPLSTRLLDGVRNKYADNGDDVMDELEPVLAAISERETNWPLVVRVLRALNITFDDSLVVVEGLQQHRASWRLEPEVTSVKPHAYVPLNEREAQLKSIIELREQSNLSAVQPLLQLLELYRKWSEDEPEVSRTNGLVIADRLIAIVAAAPEGPSYDMAMVLADVSEFYRHFLIIDRQVSLCEQVVSMMRGLVNNGSLSSSSSLLRTGLARALNLFGTGCRLQAKFDAARQAFVEALKLYRHSDTTNPDDDDDDDDDNCENAEEVAAVLHNIGHVWQLESGYVESREYFERALKIRRRVHGENHPDVAGTLDSIGTVLQKYKASMYNRSSTMNARWRFGSPPMVNVIKRWLVHSTALPAC